ncbi:MAG: hypothetical protein RL685_3237, partial [Pseudomonadota bacterium]
MGSAGTGVSSAPEVVTPSLVPGGSDAPAGSAGAGNSVAELGPAEDTPLLPTPGLLPAPEANASGYVWRPVAIGGGGFVSGIITSRTTRGLVYART